MYLIWENKCVLGRIACLYHCIWSLCRLTVTRYELFDIVILLVQFCEMAVSTFKNIFPPKGCDQAFKVIVCCQLCTSLIASCFPLFQLVQLDSLFAYWNVNSVLFSNHSADEALVSHPVITVLHLVSTSLDSAMPWCVCLSLFFWDTVIITGTQFNLG